MRGRHHVSLPSFICAGAAAPAAVSEEEMQAAMRGAEDDADAAAAAALEKEEANEAAEFNAEVQKCLRLPTFGMTLLVMNRFSYMQMLADLLMFPLTRQQNHHEAAKSSPPS